MRSTSAGELSTLAAQTRTVTQRVKVANGSGTMIDYTNWLEETNANIDIDRPVSALTVQFRRDSGPIQSLAPFRTDSSLNRLDDGVTYSPALDAGRSVTWEVATTPIGTLPQAADFKLLFKGTIDAVDFDHSPISVECRDLGSVIVDRGIEVEAAYGSGAGVALETVMQANLDTAFGSGFIPLYTPISPSYLISPAYIQQRQSEMDAQQALAQLPGWDVRYWWDSATSAFRFTLQQPPRTKTTPDYTFGPGAYFDISRLSIDRTNIRNVIAVSYFDTASNTRLVVTVSDATSITKYGRRYFFIQEADGSPINTNAEATTMANAALSDMKEPKAEAEIEMPFFWPVELWDLYRFSANGVQINSNQDWAVVSISHKLTRGSHSTILTVRGAPAGGYLTWLDRGGITGSDGRPGEVGPEAKIEIFGPPSATQAQVLYTGIGGTAPLTYQRRIDVDGISTGTYSAPAALGSGVTEWITIHQYRATRIFLRVTDATGLTGNADPFFIPGETPSTDPTPGKGTLSLVARARVITTTPTTIVARFAVGDPYPQGAASVSIAYQDLGSGGVSPGTPQTATPAATLTEVAGSYVDFTITRPAFGAGAGRVTFTATATNRQSAIDAVDVPEVDRDTVFLAMRARVLSTTPTTVVVRVAVADPYPQGAASVSIATQDLGVGSATTPASPQTVTPAATITEAAGTFVDYTVTRPAFGAGAGRVTFTATAANRTSDSDAVDVPEVDRDTVYLAMRARITATTATTLTVRVAVADPYPQGAASVSIATQDLGVGAATTPSSPQTVTPASTITEAAGTYIDYTVTRPAFGAGAGRVTFTATASNRTTDSDAVDVPEASILSSGLTLAIGTCLATNAGSTGPPFNQLEVPFTFSNMPAGTTFDVGYNNGVSGGVGYVTGLTASPATFTSVTFAGTPGKGSVTVIAQNAGVALASRIKNTTYAT